tara:strand:- start:195 stop:968 length:774 start_codon:yes stop_codon:yes gene_type:complete
MKKILSILILSITLTSSAQYNILSAVQLNEGEEEQYLALEAFFGPIHELAIEKGIQEWQAVWKVTSEIGENGPHYIINTGFSSKEQLDNYVNSWTTDDWIALAKEAHKGKISAKRVERIMSNVGSESKDRRNYHLETVDRTIWSGGSLEPGDTFILTPTTALNDNFENYETLFFKPYVEKAILNGKHGYWRLAKVYERTETAYEGITHFFFNRPVEGGSIADELPTDSFKFQKLQEGLQSSSQHADPITLELVSLNN